MRYSKGDQWQKLDSNPRWHLYGVLAHVILIEKV